MSSSAKYDDSGKKFDEEPEIIAQAVPTKPDGAAPSDKADHTRFFCTKCQTPYDLPNGATSWRCQNCMHFNSITPGECPWCTIL